MNGFTLHLMRHGAPMMTGLLLGHQDVPGSEAGCAACIARAQGIEVDAIVSSDLARAYAPAEQIAFSRNLPLRADHRWRELNFGAWNGHHPATLPRGPLAAFWDDPQEHPPPSGETWQEIRSRVDTALDDLHGPTLVIAHGGSIRAALSCLLGWDHRQVWALALPYAALVSLTVWPGETRNAQITRLLT